MLERLGRFAPLLGLVFVGLFIASFAVGGNTPNADASAQKVVSFYHSHRGSQQAASFLLAYGVLFALAFAAVLRSYLRARSNSDGLMTFGFAGMNVFVVGAAIFAGTSIAAADVPTKISPTAEQALNVLQNDTFLGLLIGLSAFMLGNGILIAATGVLPRWLGWVAVAIGIVAVTPVGFFGSLALLAWTLIVSVLMYLRQRRPIPATAAA